MAARRIWVVDDEENIARSLDLILTREGYEVSYSGSAAAFRTSDWSKSTAVLMDVRLPDANGIDLLREVRQNGASPAVIMISGHATIADAVEATRLGAFDFLEKPLGRDRVLLAVKNAVEQQTLHEENQRLRELVTGSQRMIGSSQAYRNVLEQATLAARTDARILIFGESGTGKELLANHIHEHSPVAKGPFVKVNCAAIPTELLESELFGHEKGSFTGATGLRRGKFELADGGTIFLDEVGDLPANSQAKLLRVLQEGEFHRVGGERAIRVSVRVVSATNRDLMGLVNQAQFREDLYYRLCVVPMRMPALRERVSDVRPLSEYFLNDFCQRNNFRPKRFAGEVAPLLEGYGWPGNIRELKNTVERMAILCPLDVIAAADVPAELRKSRGELPASSVHAVRESAEREFILGALEENRWNVSAAARRLGIERTNLHKRIRALGLRRN
ncbi:MAG: sigma-54-dependent Fis family transcriptional regulator [Bryobacterales bacterium]|nr:sigma-54-dependent Fis family transcriptional regulator [Bryobacterales bacterium]